ncbi:hypothetical protein [Prosthecobacter sp.]|uniref:hypothetical protein n=1 Tax=Prosthecobacter sp. TaxID=1965333 RepID=UPI0025EC261E|nr:hypothetical protein [Prosthecobacter sp.]
MGHQRSPSLTTGTGTGTYTLPLAAFLQAVKAADESGHVLLEPYDTPTGLVAAKPFVIRNASGILCVSMAPAASIRMTDPPFDTPEQNDLEEARIHAIDDYLHGKRRPIADTPPADQAGSSRAQLQALLQHVRRSQRPSGPPAGDEQARIAEARRRDKALLIDWARNAGVHNTYPRISSSRSKTTTVGSCSVPTTSR